MTAKCAVITGASRGIGAAAAEKFAGEGWNPFRLMPIRPPFVWASAAQNIDSVELDKIAEALGAEFVCAFKFPNGDEV